MLKGEWTPYRLRFKFLARTSRESMTEKPTYFVRLTSDEFPGRYGVGECALFRGLSADDVPDYEDLLSYYSKHPLEALDCRYSSIRFGFETALASLQAWNTPGFSDCSEWLSGSEGIRINGLIWMGDKATMSARIAEKLDAGFSVLKLKIGGIRFDDELDLLRHIRREFSPSQLELRLDANGSFTPTDALARLDALAHFDIHSIEQPVKAGLPDEMSRICAASPIPVALDEELIGVSTRAEADDILSQIRPSYIILKPALCGGFSGADTWIDAARSHGIGWWATSALESDIGLEAIARWLAGKGNSMPQGLGTGQLYDNNIPSALQCRGERLYNNPAIKPDRSMLDSLPWR